MTRLSKCETCRERKIKCDEQRPVCGGCMKKNRPCHYKVEKTLVNTDIGEKLLSIQGGHANATTITWSTRSNSPALSAEEHKDISTDTKSLQLKYLHRTDDSHGLYMTFKRSGCYQSKPKRSTTHKPRLSSPNNAMLCRTSKIAAQWGSIIGYESIDLNPLGKWIRMAWAAADEDTAVNLATDYTISSMIAFQSKDKAALSRAYAAGARAIQSLQTAVRTCSSRENVYNLVLAIMLHCAAEHFIKLGSFNYVAHFLGAAELLKTYHSMGGSEPLLQGAAGSNCADEMMEAIVNGRDSSVFEDICSPPTETRLGGSCDIDVATEAVQYILAQLPRLVFQGREAMERGPEAPSEIDPIERIIALFNHDANSYVQRTISAYSTVVTDDLDGLEGSPMGVSQEFSSTRTFYVAVWYYFSQIILCGLMQRLEEKYANGTVLLNIPAARARDVAAASSLAMCIEYALKPTSSRPFVALALLGPLQLSTGIWFRQQKRQASTHTSEYMHAANMVNWALAKAHIFEQMWQSAPATVERMTTITDLFAGGPYVPNRGLQ